MIGDSVSISIELDELPHGKLRKASRVVGVAERLWQIQEVRGKKDRHLSQASTFRLSCWP